MDEPRDCSLPFDNILTCKNLLALRRKKLNALQMYISFDANTSAPGLLYMREQKWTLLDDEYLQKMERWRRLRPKRKTAAYIWSSNIFLHSPPPKANFKSAYPTELASSNISNEWIRRCVHFPPPGFKSYPAQFRHYLELKLESCTHWQYLGSTNNVHDASCNSGETFREAFMTKWTI